MDYIKMIDEQLLSYLPQGDISEKTLIDSMRYSLINGGKRIRPVLVIEFCRLCGGDEKSAMPFACALEMIHTYSLIHDDLPAMDDDDFRRGKPSNHKVFGEDMAILSGDALQSLAFSVMTDDRARKVLTSDQIVKGVACLSNYCGMLGMVGGQVIDLESEGKKAGLEVLEELDRKKTAALIKAACELGCIAANADEEQIKAASDYGYSIGIAFQIVDDILDVTKTTQELGKTSGSDGKNEKSTYVSLLGIDKCRERAAELTDSAISSLKAFSGDTGYLEDFAVKLRDRQK